MYKNAWFNLFKIYKYNILYSDIPYVILMST